MTSDLPEPNRTHAGITGKVPEWAKPRAARGGRGGKRVRLSGDKRKHAKQLQKSGRISASAAKSNGL